MELFKVTDKDVEVIVVGIAKDSVRMSAGEADQLAETRELDLVQVNTKDDTPVLKLCDYSKVVYDAQKKAKEQQKKQRKNQQAVKEIKITYGTSEHDLEIKARAIDKFLKEGDKVIMSILFKGRTAKFVASGIDKINGLASLITSSYTVCQEPKIEGNKVVMIVSAKTK